MILSLFDIGYKPNRKPRASGDDPTAGARFERQIA